ncbi:MAG: hypothetical protein LBR37_02740, partial [Erysipelotrichaceae bacterium]|nr:hypothetical protein [Erysipelotrichaceae bacterium]
KTKLRCSIGVATTRFLAKMASDMKKPMGITVVRVKDIPKLIFPLRIEDLYGVGKKTAPRLRYLGINTIGDFYEKIVSDDFEVSAEIGIMKQHFYDNLRGIGDDRVYLEEHDPKSISSAHTLQSDTNDDEELLEVVEYLARDVYKSLLKTKKRGKTVTITYKRPDYRSYSKQISSKTFINSYEEFYSKLRNLYFESYDHNPIRLIGVGISGLLNPSEEVIQLTFDNYDFYEQQSTTYLLMKKINNKYETAPLMRASALKNEKKNAN